MNRKNMEDVLWMVHSRAGETGPFTDSTGPYTFCYATTSIFSTKEHCMYRSKSSMYSNAREVVHLLSLQRISPDKPTGRCKYVSHLRMKQRCSVEHIQDHLMITIDVSPACSFY